MLLSKKLWEMNSSLAYLSLETNFIQGIKNGDLPIDNFKSYIAQDYFFLESFAKAYGLAVSKCHNKESIKSLSELLLGVSNELIFHETYAKKWDIDLSINYIQPATKNYIDFLAEISNNRNLIEILSAMTPCMRLYSWIGRNLSNKTSNNPYSEWILTYSDDNFENLAKSLEHLIDVYDYSFDMDQVKFLYMRAMELELDFFKMYSDFQ